MDYALTLFASDIDITPGHLEKLEGFCEAQGLLITGKPAWIAEHRVARLPIDQLLTMDQMKTLRAIFEGARMDVFCTPRRETPYKLLIADMDATMVTGETLDELAAHAGIGEQIAAITTRAMNGELNFEEALRMRVGLLKGLDERALHETLAKTIPMPGAKEFIQALKAQGALCVLVSGGFTFFTNAIAQQLGFDHNHGNTLMIEAGKLTGHVADPILGKEAKLAYLTSYAQQLGIDLADTVAIGDGANDLPMLQAAGLGIGFQPKQLVRETVMNITRALRPALCA